MKSLGNTSIHPSPHIPPSHQAGVPQPLVGVKLRHQPADEKRGGRPLREVLHGQEV